MLPPPQAGVKGEGQSSSEFLHILSVLNEHIKRVSQAGGDVSVGPKAVFEESHGLTTPEAEVQLQHCCRNELLLENNVPMWRIMFQQAVYEQIFVPFNPKFEGI